MKKQLLKLALLGLLGSFGYADNFDINRDGKVDKVDNINYFISYDYKKIYGDKLFIANQDGSTVITKYRNKKISDNVVYTIQISGGKKYSFILKNYNKIDSKGDFIDTRMWDSSIKPLPKQEKGFKLIIQPTDRALTYILFVHYINGKFYIARMTYRDNRSGCKYIFAQKIPFPKIIDVDTFEELILKKKHTKQCYDVYDNKNEKLFDEIIKEFR